MLPHKNNSGCVSALIILCSLSLKYDLTLLNASSIDLSLGGSGGKNRTKAPAVST